MSTLHLRYPLRKLRDSSARKGWNARQYSQKPVQRLGIWPSVAVASVTVLAVTAYGVGSIYPPNFAEYISPRAAPAPPHPNSLEAISYTTNLESELQRLPYLTSLRKKSDADEWYEARPYLRFPEEKRVNSLTAGALRGVGKLALSPLVRARKDESESVVFLHVGRGVCGHDGIVHGGLVATILDETMGRTALLNLPSNIGVTANLSINYRAPTKADQFIIVRTKLESLNGRKAIVTARMEDLKGNLLADASSLFIEPRYAKLLSNSGVKAAFGAPEGPPIVADQEAAGGSV